MNALKMMLWMAAGAVTLSVCGCDVFMGEQARERPVIVEQRREVVVEQRPVIVEQRREVIVEQAPAPLIDVHVH